MNCLACPGVEIRNHFLRESREAVGQNFEVLHQDCGSSQQSVYRGQMELVKGLLVERRDFPVGGPRGVVNNRA